MANLMLNIVMAIGGIIFARFMLLIVLNNFQEKKEFYKEYVDILNNPAFKVKRSCE